jgi:general stress protein 26
MDKVPGDGDMATVAALIREIRIALLTTVDGAGRLHTRPVQVLQFEANEILWFFTGWNSRKAEQLENDEHVSVGFSDPSSNTFVAVSGLGRLLQDPSKARQLWTVEQRAYYPEGPEDPRLALLRVQIERAEYWLAPGRAAYFVAAARAAVTGEAAAIVGAHGEVG